MRTENLVNPGEKRHGAFLFFGVLMKLSQRSTPASSGEQNQPLLTPYIASTSGAQATSKRASVLCLGRNPMLLQTRQAVLAKRFRVLSVGSLDELVRQTSAPDFDVFVLCHTLSKPECRQAADLARRRWPKVKILALNSGSGTWGRENSDTSVESLDGPAVLLRAVQELLPFIGESGFSASI